MSLSKIIILLLCLTTRAWADSKYYNDFDKQISEQSKRYDFKITHVPPIDFSAHYDHKKAVEYGDLLGNDWHQVMNARIDSHNEYQNIANIIASLRQKNLLTESEYKKLIIKLDKTQLDIQTKLVKENEKFIEYN